MIRSLKDGHEEVAGVPDVSAGQLQEDLLRILLFSGDLLELLVVEARVRYGCLEDGGVRGNANDPLFYHRLQLAAAYNVAGEGIYPDALPHPEQLSQPLVHWPSPPESRFERRAHRSRLQFTTEARSHSELDP